MDIIFHRINTINKLKNIDTRFGIEIDIRSHDGELILSHDSFSYGEFFVDWIEKYKHKLLIVNVKEDGLEDKIVHLLLSKRIDNYFFLDQSFPSIYKYFTKLDKKIAIRFSEFESIETVLMVSNMCSWVWIDNFNRLPITKLIYDKIKELGLKTCIVSPELVDVLRVKEIPETISFLIENEIQVDAVCTKYPQLWSKLT